MAQALRRTPTSVDVSDPRLYQDDTWRPLFAELRRDDPVHYCEASRFGPYWSVTRYDDIFAVELDHQNYSSSSELGGIQITDQPKGRELANFIRMLARSFQHATGRGVDHRGNTARLRVERVPTGHDNSVRSNSPQCRTQRSTIFICRH